MKKIEFIVLAALSAAFVIQSCKKAAVPITNLEATKTQIVAGEIDNLLFTGAGAADSLNWTVSPGGSANLHPKGNTATITFAAPGTYVITAQKSGGIPASVTIKAIAGTGTDVTKSDNVTISTVDTLQLVPITTDVIMMPQIYHPKTAGDSIVINFTAFTYLTDKYCGQAILQFKSVISAGNSFNLDLVNLREAKGCAITSYHITSGSSDSVFENKLLGVGTYPLTVTVNSVTRYSGSITISAKKITFNWPYTSGVTIPDIYKVLAR